MRCLPFEQSTTPGTLVALPEVREEEANTCLQDRPQATLDTVIVN